MRYTRERFSVLYVKLPIARKPHAQRRHRPRFFTCIHDIQKAREGDSPRESPLCPMIPPLVKYIFTIFMFFYLTTRNLGIMGEFGGRYVRDKKRIRVLE